VTGPEAFVLRFQAVAGSPASRRAGPTQGRTTVPAWAPRCRVHGAGCGVPWGYDEAHTDQAYPYTVEQLATRTHGLHYYAYPDHEAYLEGWKLWLALRRDHRLNRDEAAVRQQVRCEHHGPRLRELGFTDEQVAQMFGVDGA
jgi:hypothetical protein